MITPSRKVSFIIILNKNDYNEECLKILCNRHFYEFKKDPSASYKDRFTNFCHILLHDSLITKNKYDILLEGNKLSLTLNAQEKIFIDSMDVQSLYPNTDHKKHIDAFSYVFDKRTNQSFPTRVTVK